MPGDWHELPLVDSPGAVETDAVGLRHVPAVALAISFITEEARIRSEKRIENIQGDDAC